MSLPDQHWQVVLTWLVMSLFVGVFSYLSCLAALKLAKKSGMISLPGERQSHVQATPTGGGLGLVFCIVVSSLSLELINSLPVFWWQRMLPGVLLLALVGWRDDRVSVSATVRLAVQFIVSIWLIEFGWWGGSFTGTLVYGVVLLAVVWLMNVYNFMDGSNGMAGFQGVFAGLVMAVLFQTGGQPALGLLAIVIAAACAGFIPLNFPNAKVFMGDVSSVPLGFMFASLAIYGIQNGSLSLAVFILIMAVFLVDATLTLFARAFRREQWYTAHAQHVYQRLIALGWSHHRVLVVYQAINVFVVLPAIVLATIYPQYAIVMAGLTIFVLVSAWYITNRRLGLIAEERIK